MIRFKSINTSSGNPTQRMKSQKPMRLLHCRRKAKTPKNLQVRVFIDYINLMNKNIAHFLFHVKPLPALFTQLDLHCTEKSTVCSAIILHAIELKNIKCSSCDFQRKLASLAKRRHLSKRKKNPRKLHLPYQRGSSIHGIVIYFDMLISIGNHSGSPTASPKKTKSGTRKRMRMNRYGFSFERRERMFAVKQIIALQSRLEITYYIANLPGDMSKNYQR